jgi:L-histidine N-alpha-methyltransferase
MNLTERQQYELLAAISARGEIPVKFVYLGQGASLWDDLYRSAEHHSGITNEEMSMLMSRIESFLQVFNGASGINLIDLGCGNGLPAIEILKKLKTSKVPVNYVAVDLSQEMLTLASENIKKVMPDTPITELQLDFESESLAGQLLGIKRKSKLPNLLINLGNTLGNYVNASAVLTNFLESMTLEDYLIVGNGLVNDQNTQKILSTYVDVDQQKEIIITPAKDLGLYTAKDDYKVLWNPVQHRVEARIKLNEGRLLSLAGQSVSMEVGDEILIMQSHKYTESSLTKLLSNVGFRTELLTTNRNRSYILAMIQPTRYSAS